jgi:hypothetical protein
MPYAICADTVVRKSAAATRSRSLDGEVKETFYDNKIETEAAGVPHRKASNSFPQAARPLRPSRVPHRDAACHRLSCLCGRVWWIG